MSEKKSLFNEWGLYTKEAKILEKELTKKIKPIIKKTISKYRSNDVSALMHGILFTEIAFENAMQFPPKRK